MTSIFLQPCGSDEAIKNYENTIENPVDLSNYKELISPNDYQRLIEIYPNGLAQVWGITPGVNNINVSKWENVKPGDITLMYKGGVYFSSAVTTYVLHNPDLAEKLWGIDGKFQTWEYMYFLAEVKNTNIPKTELNEKIDYKIDFSPRGFMKSKISEEVIVEVLNDYNLLSEMYYADIDSSSFNRLKDILINTDGILDKPTIAYSRVEQDILRRNLFNQKPVAICCICQSEYPTQFMVAAHIKKRSECNRNERLDIENIVSPMCKFGCDELYERGYISVNNGVVVILNNKNLTSPIQDYLNSIEGNYCSFWNPQTMPYFQWHLEKNKRKGEL